ncbi:hypothetical protein [Desulfurobacterium indicum]|uniref:Uncharacterized protein n=1 Tax=Desulfurobacterium indicum TaxID=1914305 RepID=A0A1R1MLR5_9BACT|nr:hypothetical protein [Desulfurobacterium indicum]OMH40762.1 hypothetical protein BLW93_03550 [Desulfurobacterium indicum]
MKLYIGYPESCTENEKFKIKDLFLKEVNVSYDSIPIEVKKKLLSLLDFLKEKDYIFIDNVHYDASDILEFALFGIKNRKIEHIILPGYTYGKPTFIIRETLKTISNNIKNNINIYYDFNLFSEETLVINIGYRKTSISIGGKFLSVIDIGEFNFIDVFGNYLFNRFLKDKGMSNVYLRKTGKRGRYLDRFRGIGARILLKRCNKVILKDENYNRTVNKEEIKLGLSILTGQTNFGEFTLSITDLSSAIVNILYSYEEVERQKPTIKNIVIIGRIAHLYQEPIERIFGLHTEIITPQELLNRSISNFRSRIIFQKIETKYNTGDYSDIEMEIDEKENFKDYLFSLRRYFRDRDIKGVKIIERLTETNLSNYEKETFINELLTIGRITSFKDTKMIPYIDYIISALSKINIPEHLLPEVENYIKKVAFRWSLPLKTRMNIIYFCYKHKDVLKDREWFKVLLPLTITWIRDKKLSEGERQFIRAATGIK